jgi:hypothetical protein
MPIISAKEAVKQAMVFLAELQESNPPEDVTIEEVELCDDGSYWWITISFFPSGSSIAAITGQKTYKKYKIFKVDASLGTVISMKMRDFDQ